MSSSLRLRALGVGLLVSAFVACSDDKASTGGGSSGSSARAGSSTGAVDTGGSGAMDAGSGGRPSSGGTSNEAGAGGRDSGDAGSPGEPEGGASGSDAGGADTGGTSAAGTSNGGSGGTGGGGGSGGTGNTGNVSSIPGVPCEVATVLKQKCNACHNDPPVLDAPFALTTYDSLAEHAEAVQEVLDADLMPPSPLAPLPEDEKEALLGWLEAGVPHTTGPCE